MAIKGGRRTGHGGTGSAAITNDDDMTYEEPDNGVDDFNDKSSEKLKDPRSS